MKAATETYLETLLLYYEEEVEGEAYFRALSERFSDPDHKTKLALLAEVEAHTAKGVAPLIAKYGLVPRLTARLVESGVTEAGATQADWGALLAEMTETYPHYVDAFERLEAMGPPEDRQALSFLTGHEVAAMAFLALETSLSRDSTVPLHTFLARSPETWQRAESVA